MIFITWYSKISHPVQNRLNFPTSSTNNKHETYQLKEACWKEVCWNRSWKEQLEVREAGKREEKVWI